MADDNELAKRVTLLLGASAMLVMSAEAAAAVSRAPSGEVLTAIRQAVKSGETNIGQARVDGNGRLILSAFNDVWNKWEKQFSDSSPV